MSDKLKQFFNDPNGRSAVVGALCFGSGLAVGYWLTRRPVQVIHPAQPVQEIPVTKMVIDQEVLQAKREAAVVITPVTPDDSVEPITVDEEPVARSIFAADNENWDYDAEIAARREAVPYTIHKDEFYAAENGYHQSTLTYYTEDNILVDEMDAPIYNVEHIVGELKFGHGSGDPGVVYIRNEKRKGEYEVLRIEGSYAIEVQGLEPDDTGRSKSLEHSQVKRFRPE